MMDYKTASEIAVSKCVHLQPHTLKINIAGSLRRKKEVVKDIEIVCVPSMSTTLDLFGQASGMVRSPAFIDTVKNLGTILKGNPSGKYLQITLPEGINLDLFITTTEDYYRQYAIRTGPADYSAGTIAAAWKRKGWRGSDHGLRKLRDCVDVYGADGKRTWKCINRNGERPPAWQSEEEFFAWIGRSYMRAEYRE